MFPTLHLNDIVIVDTNVPFSTLKIGVIIVFRTFGTTNASQHEIIIHRAAQTVTDTQGDRIIRTTKFYSIISGKLFKWSGNIDSAIFEGLSTSW